MRNKWLPVIGWMALIFFGSSLPSTSVSENTILDIIIHKIAHLLEYSVLGFFSMRAAGKRYLLLAIPIVFAATDEIHQLFVPSRQGRLHDFLIDSSGVLLGAFIYHSYIKYWKRV